MPSWNHCEFIGHVGRDPELKYLPSGDAVVSFSLAVSEKWKDKQTGEKKESTLWVEITAFKQTAEFTGQYIKKGDAVMAVGKIKEDHWENDEGEKRSKMKLVAQIVKPLGEKAEKKEEAPAVVDDDSVPF